MASINKLSIRGVRAFNPEDVEQVRPKLKCRILMSYAGRSWYVRVRMASLSHVFTGIGFTYKVVVV